jgi:hypothetical protein
MDLFRKIWGLEDRRAVIGVAIYEESLVIHIAVKTRRRSVVWG